MGPSESIIEILYEPGVTAKPLPCSDPKNVRIIWVPARVKPKSIRAAPGTWLLRCSEFIYSRKKYELALLPTIADMREEYFDALATGRVWKSRWVRVRELWSFWAAVGTDIPISAIGLVKKIWTAAN